jgi:hypothetical protein
MNYFTCGNPDRLRELFLFPPPGSAEGGGGVYFLLISPSDGILPAHLPEEGKGIAAD